MTSVASGEITDLLAAWKDGEQTALKRLIPLVYPQLRRLARRHLAHRKAADSLESGVLVNEAYLKLVQAEGILCQNRTHFMALCSQMIRRILVDHARHQLYAKRGGTRVRVALDDTIPQKAPNNIEVLALDEALTSLAEIDPRKVRVVEMRSFGGLSVEETSQVLGISQETVLRDWTFAKAWLGSRLR